MKKILLSLISVAPIALASRALAVVEAPRGIPPHNKTVLAGGPNGIAYLLSTVANWMFTILVIFSVIMLLLAAYNYMFSQGNEENIKKAHKMIFYAVIALIVGFLANGIVYVVEELVTG